MKNGWILSHHSKEFQVFFNQQVDPYYAICNNFSTLDFLTGNIFIIIFAITRIFVIKINHSQIITKL